MPRSLPYGKAHRWRIPVEKPQKGAQIERFPIGELSRYLRDRRGEARKYAKSRGLLHSVTARRPNGTKVTVFWVSAWGAMQTILHVRAVQGARYLKNG